VQAFLLLEMNRNSKKGGLKMVKFLVVVGVIVLAIGISAVLGYLFGLAWNAILVPWAHAPHLNFWLAWLVCFVLGFILFR
jgi:hypothetical protein